MTENRSQLQTDINTNLADNTTGAITPALLRTTLLNMLNNMPTLLDADTFATAVKTFGVAPILTGLNGLLWGNGASAISSPLPNAVPGSLSFFASQVNFNSGNTDTSVAIQLPPGSTRYKVSAVHVSHASVSLTTATVGVFTAAGGGGQTISALATTGITATATDSNNNSSSQALTNAATEFYNDATLYVRIGTAQGAPATADVTIVITPLP